MSIRHAILGFLSWMPLTGYDLKKLFAESPTLHWSGNNNQIYTALVDLFDEGLVSKEVQQQEDRPARKVYSITPQGRAELRQWVLSTPELPQIRNTFLVQLAWADQLTGGELDDLLARYVDELHVHLLMLQEQRRRGYTAPARTPREALLWDAIMDNRISAYENELAWARRLRQSLAGRQKLQETNP